MSNKNPATLIDSFSGNYRFLSNFWACNVILGNDTSIIYPSTEHAFQAAKTLDSDVRKFISKLATAGEAKREGRKIDIRPDWESVKLGIMYDLLSQKFSNEPLRSWLLETGSSLLVEGNTWNDTFWGVCYGIGKNHLGKLLMQVRADINTAKMVEA